MSVNIIVTGVTGMVGEGVLLECLSHPAVAQVTSLSRRSSGIQHPKLKEVLVKDFFHLENVEDQLKDLDGCLYCAGVSSNGMSEAEYTKITYDTALHVAKTLLKLNPEMVFSHVSGSHTNEKSKIMWSRVKGKTESALIQLPFKSVYNFRPALMKPTAEQKNIKGFYRFMLRLLPLLKLFFPMITMEQMGRAMINSVLKGYPKPILEVEDIKVLALS